MPQIILSVLTDSEVEKKAQEFLESLGLDVERAINIFFEQTAQQKKFPFTIPPGSKVVKIPREKMFGYLRGQYKISDDFDKPLDDFKDYM